MNIKQCITGLPVISALPGYRSHMRIILAIDYDEDLILVSLPNRPTGVWMPPFDFVPAITDTKDLFELLYD